MNWTLVKVPLALRCCFLAVLQTLPSEILSEIGYCLCVFVCVKESKKQKDTRRRQRDRETERQRHTETQRHRDTETQRNKESERQRNKTGSEEKRGREMRVFLTSSGFLHSFTTLTLI